MMLREAIDQYIVWQRARGASFESSAYALRRFRRSVGSAIGSDEVRADQARAFLDEGATSASNRAFLHSALRGFYRYAIARGLATHSPLPPQPPQASPRSTPYIYSHDELRRLLDATKSYRKRVNQLEPYTFRALLLLLYGAGLRRGEALRLTRADVDLRTALLTVRQTKFDKTRYVPLAPQLSRAMQEYAAQRQAAGVVRGNAARYQPRLHDLRHSFAVHRLTAWHRQGKDAQRLLPLLSTYLGHSSVAATQVYLDLTPELLRAAASRFQRYAASGNGGRHD